MMKWSYYNDNDPKVCAWIRKLIEEGLIEDGEVDERSITEVPPGDIKGFRRAHFFCGIGGWSYALRLAGWPDDRIVWTGSCPCQPFSAAGKRRGIEDKRHLWPAFRWLIAQCRPPIVFGEQVASKDGREWLSGVRTDLEAMGYAVGAADLCAAWVGAPHLRQRLWWVADADDDGRGTGSLLPTKKTGGSAQSDNAGKHGGVADPHVLNGKDGELQRGGGFVRPEEDQVVGDRVADPKDAYWRTRKCREEAGVGEDKERGSGSAIDSVTSGMADTEHDGGRANESGRGQKGRNVVGGVGPWDDSRWIICQDGKARRIPIKRELQPLAHGIPGRVGVLRGSGNSIVPQVAEAFIRAYMETKTWHRKD